MALQGLAGGIRHQMEWKFLIHRIHAPFVHTISVAVAAQNTGS